MDLYTRITYEMSELLTRRYSTSFSMSSKLFEPSIRPHIYAIYGMVRLADEIVDTYAGEDAEEKLKNFCQDVTAAVRSGYSVNPVIHAFADSARRFGITEELMGPFFESMAMDLAPRQFDRETYERYIYGSAEVVGLMCLRVFVAGDEVQYAELSEGARALGAAYQKVNFLRDMQADYEKLGRVYFPGVTYDQFDADAKAAIIADIEKDFSMADEVISRLPTGSRKAVRASSYYYQALLARLKSASPAVIKSKRLRVPGWRKLLLLVRAAA